MEHISRISSIFFKNNKRHRRSYGGSNYRGEILLNVGVMMGTRIEPIAYSGKKMSRLAVGVDKNSNLIKIGVCICKNMVATEGIEPTTRGL